MYLNARRHLWTWNEESGDKAVAEHIQEIAKIPEHFPVKEIKIEAGYWRKSNQIHQWFVQNVQDGTDDCGNYYVSKQDLIDLREVCQKVIADNSLAPTLLPTASGFFFGAKEYEDWYYRDLDETVKILDKALSLGSGWDFEYHSSW